MSVPVSWHILGITCSSVPSTCNITSDERNYFYLLHGDLLTPAYFQVWVPLQHPVFLLGHSNLPLSLLVSSQLHYSVISSYCIFGMLMLYVLLTFPCSICQFDLHLSQLPSHFLSFSTLYLQVWNPQQTLALTSLHQALDSLLRQVCINTLYLQYNNTISTL